MKQQHNLILTFCGGVIIGACIASISLGRDSIYKLIFASSKPTATTRFVEHPISVKGEPFLGSESANIAIVEFTDFECPYSRKFHAEVFPLLKREYLDKGIIQFVHKDLPLEFHQNARKSALLARCSKSNKQYWDIYNALFSKQKCLECMGPSSIVISSSTLGQADLDKCGRDANLNRLVNLNISEDSLNNISGTPNFVIGKRTKDGVRGQILVGVVPWSHLKTIIDQEILRETKSKR